MLTALLITICVLLLLIWLTLGGIYQANKELHGRLAECLAALQDEIEGEGEAIAAVDAKINTLEMCRGLTRMQ